MASAQAPLVAINVSPQVTSVQVGSTVSYSATGIYSDCSTQDLTSAVIWSSSNSNSAAIGSDGTATGATACTSTQISATSNGITGTANLTVWPVLTPSCTLGGNTLPGNQIYFFQRNQVPVAMTLTNASSGATVTLNGTYNGNTATYQGQHSFNTLLMSNLPDLLSLDQGGVETFCNMNRIVLGDGDDVLDMTSARLASPSAIILGGNGNQVIWSGRENDTITTGGGSTRIDTGTGNDTVNGGSGDDTLRYSYNLQGSAGPPFDPRRDRSPPVMARSFLPPGPD